MKIQPVIMSGGSGTRLWPLSRTARPKQFLKLVTDKSMFQETALRVHDETGAYQNPVIIAGRKHGAIVAEQLTEIGIEPAEIILEPCPRNTAAVAAVAACWVARGEEDTLVLLMPADHHIADAGEFRRAVDAGAKAAEDGYIVTFGIKPESPHTGYGYIQTGAKLRTSVFEVAAFKEKPELKTAEKYIDDGGYFWNAGIFLFSAKAMLDELERHAPDIRKSASKALEESAMSGAALRLDEPAFELCPSNSIDYAVMEKTEKAAIVAPVDVGWTDIGSWSELDALLTGENVVAIGSENCVIRSDGPMVGVAGVDNLIIVATSDAVLVARRDNAQEVRAIVEELKKRGRADLL